MIGAAECARDIGGDVEQIVGRERRERVRI